MGLFNKTAGVSGDRFVTSPPDSIRNQTPPPSDMSLRERIMQQHQRITELEEQQIEMRRVIEHMAACLTNDIGINF